MSWITTVGLALDAVGALFVLAPRLQILMHGLDKFWWFQNMEVAKAQLYRDGQIDRDTPGFKHIAAAVKYGNNWTKLPGESLEDGGYHLFEIERIEDEDAYPMIEELKDRPPISQTIFTLKYRPSAADEADVPILKEMSPFMAAQSPPGQLPRHIQDHKERLVFRLGAGLLFFGFVLQLIPSAWTLLAEVGVF